MTKRDFRKSWVGERRLAPETLMLGFGFDPELSEGRGEDTDLSDLDLRLQDV